VVLSLLRLWNYNRSRTHASRGVRRVQLRLDDRLVFDGEVRKAPGDLIDPQQGCEVNTPVDMTEDRVGCVIDLETPPHIKRTWTARAN
jgi:hypothetical protein